MENIENHVANQKYSQTILKNKIPDRISSDLFYLRAILFQSFSFNEMQLLTYIFNYNHSLTYSNIIWFESITWNIRVSVGIRALLVFIQSSLFITYTLQGKKNNTIDDWHLFHCARKAYSNHRSNMIVNVFLFDKYFILRIWLDSLQLRNNNTRLFSFCSVSMKDNIWSSWIDFLLK